MTKQGRDTKVMEGSLIADLLKRKNGNGLYPAFLFLALTKNLKFLYINLDSVLLVSKLEEVPFKMTVFDKIYGQ